MKRTLLKNMATENNSATNASTVSLASAMQRLVQDTELADLTVTCGDKKWKVHSAILAVRSPFFKAAVTNNMAEKHEMKIDIKDFDPEAMEEVINFMYGVPKEKAPMKFLFEAAERFQMDDLKEYAVKLARKETTVTNVVDLGHIAEMYGIEGFLGECAKFIVKNDVPLKEEDMSPKLAIMVVNIFKDANQKLNESRQKLKRKLQDSENELKVSYCSYSGKEGEWSRLHDVRLNGQLLEFVGSGRSDVSSAHAVGLAQAKTPLSISNHYFEIEIIDPGSRCYIVIGLARKDYPRNRLPGWNKGSIAYHADNGNIFMGRSYMADPFGPLCNKGDTMGCGIMLPSNSEGEQEDSKAAVNMREPDFNSLEDYDTDSGEDEATYHGDNVHVYFTRNGKFIGMKKVMLPRGGFFPTVGMMSCGEKVRVDLKPDCNPVSIE